MALPLLPEQHIQPMFVRIESRAAKWEMRELINYAYRLWIDHPLYVRHCWSACTTSQSVSAITG